MVSVEIWSIHCAHADLYTFHNETNVTLICHLILVQVHLISQQKIHAFEITTSFLDEIIKISEIIICFRFA